MKALCTLLLAATALAAPGADPVPLVRAHAHNDYAHRRPLLDALEHGFCSIEADVWLVDGKLLVAHDRDQVRPGATLEKLYLDPLRRRAKRNRGRVYADGPTLTLLVDVKSDATNTYAALRRTLERYRDVLTRFHADRTETNAVTVIISGNRARGWMESEPTRLAAYDGRLADLDLEPPPSTQFIPLVSDNWTRLFRWRGQGPFPDNERAELRRLVERAHGQGRRLRLWAAPDSPAGWRELAAAGVDWINTDDLAGLRNFLLGKPDGATSP
jgi:glycerophosphoryl diester phosphodiesterase